MGQDDSSMVAEILDRMIREKEISAAFFARVADGVEDVDRRRWFRRLGQDEKDQRKILMKHRRGLCGAVARGKGNVSSFHQALSRAMTDPPCDLLAAMRLAVLSAEESRSFYNKASEFMTDRSCKIFLKILAEESDEHRRCLIGELRRMEKEFAIVEEVAA